MKRIIISITCAAAAIASLASCEKFFDRQPEDKFAAELFFKSETDLRYYTNGLIDAALPSYDDIALGSDRFSDFCATKESTTFLQPDRYSAATAGGWTYSEWSFLRQVAYMLDNMPNAKGAAPVVASVAKEKGILTVGVVTKPFDWEGEAKMQMALGGISEMKKYVDALIIIPNNRVRELKGSKPKVSLKEAFGEVDDILCKAVTGMIKLLQGDGYINVDFADITMALHESGIAHIAIGKGKGDNKIDEALNEVLNSPLLETSIDGARRGLLNVSIPSSFPLDEFDGLSKEISEKFNADAKFKCGIVFDDTLADDEMSLIVVATDFAEESDPAVLTGVSSLNVPVEGPTPEESTDFELERDSVGKMNSSPFSGGFNDSQDIDTLLRKFNQGKDN